MNTAAMLLENRRNKNALEAQLIAVTEAKSTAQLLAAHAELDRRAKLDEAERIVSATIADVLTARHDLDDALDAIFDDVDYAGSYHDAILAALAAAGVEL